jgi:argininosuccinate lyase
VKLWSKPGQTAADLDARVERFTVGDDPILDQRLVPHDCRASLAHAEMLHAIDVLDADELDALRVGLAEIVELHARGEFVIAREDEDGHTAIEKHLTARCGEAGRKIHTARSRNDQVLCALRLFEKEALGAIDTGLVAFVEALRELRLRQGALEMPGYTHLRRAMPSSVGLWAECFIEAAIDDRLLLDTAFTLIDRSPLGTAAGFGVPGIEIDRERTATALGFAAVLENPIHAQLGRGKLEGVVLGVCSQVLHDLNRFASDLLLFSTSEFGFVTLPPQLCTGSSIMPQKRNPDLLELLRAKYHVVLAREMEVRSLVASLPSGYHRDLQLTKGPVISGLETTADCLEIAQLAVTELAFDEAACRAAMTSEIHATRRANEAVRRGVPFRDAYRQVAAELESSPPSS